MSKGTVGGNHVVHLGSITVLLLVDNHKMLSKVMDLWIRLLSVVTMLFIWTVTVVDDGGFDDSDVDGDVYTTWGQCPSGMGGVLGVVHSPEN